MPRQLRSRRQRRGVLILVVLSLLVMFVLVAVAFVISAGQHRTAARAASRHDLTGTPPRQQLDETMRQLLRGTTNAASALKDADLLGDLYGSAADGATGTLAAAPTAVAGGQFFDLTVAALPNTTPEFYSGRVLTFTTGQAKNISTRIIANPSSTTLRILCPPTTAAAVSGDKFRINGRPFSGDGLSAAQPNEDYDALDNNNPFLGAFIPGATPQVTPSFDRTTSGGPTKRVFGQITDPTTERWDVDNDGDGVFDSIWIDVGFPPEAAADGRLYKALVAILCVDLDGRLNLNAHGSYAHLNALPTAQTLAGGTVTTHNMPRGEGYGPPEISLQPVLTSDYATFLQGTASIPGRYGANSTLGERTPGLFNTYDDLAKLRFFQYPQDFSSTTLSAFGSPSNLQGNLAFGLGNRGELIYDGVNTTQLTDSAYELNLGQNAPSGVNFNAADTPFSIAELERLLRPFDADAALLPNRLIQLASSTDMTAARHMLTTHSFDLPVYGVDPGGPGTDLRTQLVNAGYSPSAIPCPVAPELLLGLPMDLNRPFGNGVDDNGNFVVDEEEEAGSETVWGAGGNNTHLLSSTNHPTYSSAVVDRDSSGTTDSPPTLSRQLYAGQLYVLLSLMFNSGEDPTISRNLAQWAVNVVDFRDADSIMTRFDYDPTPLSGGWTPSEVVWGCERPELLITESLAFHDRRTEDTNEAGAGDEYTEGHATMPDPADADDDFDQKKVPRSGFFVELYNPWPIGSLKAPGELFDAGGNGVQLGKVSANGNSPVWRILVVRGDSKGKDPEDPDDPVVDADIERTIYFATAGGVGVSKIYHANAAGGNLQPGRYAVIGTSGTTYLGERSDANVDRRRIELAANDVAVFNDNGGTITRDPAALPAPPLVVEIDKLSITEPTGSVEDPGYETYGVYDATDPANPIYNPPLEEPVDKTRSLDADLDLEGIWSDSQQEEFRWIYLQRLANPLEGYDPATNPYLTVDAQPVNLTPFNGNASPSDPDADVPGNATGISTHQRGVDDADNTVNIWRRGESNAPPASNAGTNLHHFDFNINHTLGYINAAYNPTTPPASNDPTTPFPWLVWNNRPFVSQYELMQVPFVRSSQLTAVHNAPSAALANKNFNYLFDFSSSGAFYKLLDYVHVPSRFPSAHQWFNPGTFAPGTAGLYPYYAPHNRLSRFRDPGKINLNTIFHPEVWNGLMHNVSGMMTQPGPTWAQFQTSRNTTPFRSFNRGTAAESLLRDGATPNTPLFSGVSTNPANDTTRNSYFRHQALVRLANLTTTRSNVYAVWITLGYFEVDSAGAPLPQGTPNRGRELGSDTGDIHRHRAFYLIDRTIPVGYDPGKNLNTDDAVLLRRFIE